MDAYLPIKNRDDDETYSVLIEDLSKCGIEKSSELISLIKEQLKTTLQEDAEIAKKIICKESKATKSMILMANKGVFYNHSGLIRGMLKNKYHLDLWVGAKEITRLLGL